VLSITLTDIVAVILLVGFPPGAKADCSDPWETCGLSNYVALAMIILTSCFFLVAVVISLVYRGQRGQQGRPRSGAGHTDMDIAGPPGIDSNFVLLQQQTAAIT